MSLTTPNVSEDFRGSCIARRSGTSPRADQRSLSESRMREIRTSGLMSGDGRRSDLSVATAPVLDSTPHRRSADLQVRAPKRTSGRAGFENRRWRRHFQPQMTIERRELLADVAVHALGLA